MHDPINLNKKDDLLQQPEIKKDEEGFMSFLGENNKNKQQEQGGDAFEMMFGNPTQSTINTTTTNKQRDYNINNEPFFNSTSNDKNKKTDSSQVKTKNNSSNFDFSFPETKTSNNYISDKQISSSTVKKPEQQPNYENLFSFDNLNPNTNTKVNNIKNTSTNTGVKKTITSSDFDLDLLGLSDSTANPKVNKKNQNSNLDGLFDFSGNSTTTNNNPINSLNNNKNQNQLNNLNFMDNNQGSNFDDLSYLTGNKITKGGNNLNFNQSNNTSSMNGTIKKPSNNASNNNNLDWDFSTNSTSVKKNNNKGLDDLLNF